MGSGAVEDVIEAPEGLAISNRRTTRWLRRYRWLAWFLLAIGYVVTLSMSLEASKDPVGATVCFLIIFVFALIAGLVMTVRARRWRRVLKRAPWVAYRSQYVLPPGAFVLTPLSGSAGDAIPIRVWASRGRHARLEQADPRSVWVAGDPKTRECVIALPRTGELVAVAPPRRRGKPRFLAALRASGALPDSAELSD
jgi:hypothetical protein